MVCVVQPWDTSCLRQTLASYNVPPVDRWRPVPTRRKPRPGLLELLITLPLIWLYVLSERIELLSNDSNIIDFLSLLQVHKVIGFIHQLYKFHCPQFLNLLSLLQRCVQLALDVLILLLLQSILYDGV